MNDAACRGKIEGSTKPDTELSEFLEASKGGHPIRVRVRVRVRVPRSQQGGSSN